MPYQSKMVPNKLFCLGGSGWHGVRVKDGGRERVRCPKQVDVDRVFGLFWVVQVGMAWANQVRR